MDIPKPLPGETADEYIHRVHFEQDEHGRWWCLDCGALIRTAGWLVKHYNSAHGLRGF
jgi:hypothetical protein